MLSSRTNVIRTLRPRRPIKTCLLHAIQFIYIFFFSFTPAYPLYVSILIGFYINFSLYVYVCMCACVCVGKEKRQLRVKKK